MSNPSEQFRPTRRKFLALAAAAAVLAPNADAGKKRRRRSAPVHRITFRPTVNLQVVAPSDPNGVPEVLSSEIEYWITNKPKKADVKVKVDPENLRAAIQEMVKRAPGRRKKSDPRKFKINGQEYTPGMLTVMSNALAGIVSDVRLRDEQDYQTARSLYANDLRAAPFMNHPAAFYRRGHASVAKKMTLQCCAEIELMGLATEDMLVTYTATAAAVGGTQRGGRAGTAYKRGDLLDGCYNCSFNDDTFMLAVHDGKLILDNVEKFGTTRESILAWAKNHYRFNSSIDNAEAQAYCAFMWYMNKRAQEMGMLSSLYYTPNGMPPEQTVIAPGYAPLQADLDNVVCAYDQYLHSVEYASPRFATFRANRGPGESEQEETDDTPEVELSDVNPDDALDDDELDSVGVGVEGVAITSPIDSHFMTEVCHKTGVADEYGYARAEAFKLPDKRQYLTDVSAGGLVESIGSERQAFNIILAACSIRHRHEISESFINNVWLWLAKAVTPRASYITPVPSAPTP